MALSLVSPAVAADERLDPCADVALVLALDGSDSVDAGEYRFQQQALAGALRDPEVLKAFAAAGTVQMAVIFWGEAGLPAHHAGTITIRDASDAERFARAIES